MSTRGPLWRSVLDEFFRAVDVVAVLEAIIAETGIQSTFVLCDNGPEFTAGALVDWSNAVWVSTAIIDLGSPWQNLLIESINAQFRLEQISSEIMDAMVEAKYLPEEWKDIYNHERSHESLEGATPFRFWDELVKEIQLAIAYLLDLLKVPNHILYELLQFCTVQQITFIRRLPGSRTIVRTLNNCRSPEWSRLKFW